MKIIITGGGGFIGSHVANLLSESSQVLVIDKSEINHRYINDKVEFCKADLLHSIIIHNIVENFKPNIVLHYAAMVGVEETQKNPIKVFQDIHSTENLLSACSKNDVKIFLYISSSEVYGSVKEYPITLDSPLNGNMPYALTKKVCESLVESYAKKYGIDYSIIRPFNTYGPRQSPEFVVTRFILQAILNHNITIYGDGSQTRSFLYVNDHASLIKTILDRKLFNGQIINAGTEDEISINDLADQIANKIGGKIGRTFLPPLKAGDMPRRYCSSEGMVSLLGRPLTVLSTGLDYTVKFYLDNSTS